MKEMMGKILEKDPKKRINFDEVLKEKWFDGMVPEVFSTTDDIFD